MPILWEVVNHAHERMVGLSKQFGETQLFASVRTSSCYLWARAVNGKLLRLFYNGDGERRVVGESTEAEKEQGSVSSMPPLLNRTSLGTGSGRTLHSQMKTVF